MHAGGSAGPAVGDVSALTSMSAHSLSRRRERVEAQMAAARVKTEISLPVLGLVALTRGLLGAGIAFAVADRVQPAQRKAIGWTLVAVGAITTVPLLLEVFGNRSRPPA